MGFRKSLAMVLGGTKKMPGLATPTLAWNSSLREKKESRMDESSRFCKNFYKENNVHLASASRQKAEVA